MFYRYIISAKLSCSIGMVLPPEGNEFAGPLVSWALCKLEHGMMMFMLFGGLLL